jgi:hypothetical protein
MTILDRIICALIGHDWQHGILPGYHHVLDCRRCFERKPHPAHANDDREPWMDETQT